MKPVLAGAFGILMSTLALPVLAADYPARTQAHYGADTSMRIPDGYELRRYYIDTGRAYGAPVNYYARVTPAPPTRFIYADGVRGRARVEIDDRPPFPGPDWIKLTE